MSATASKGRRYPASVMRRARELRDAGWSIDAISDLVAQEHGQRPACATVLRWVDPEGSARRDRAARVRLRQRRASTGTYRFKLAGHADSPEYQAAFVRALRDEGASTSGIAATCNLLLPGEWTTTRVGTILRGGVPHHLRQMVTGGDLGAKRRPEHC